MSEQSSGEQHLDALVDLVRPRLLPGQVATFNAHVRLIRAELVSLDGRPRRRRPAAAQDEESRTG